MKNFIRFLLLLLTISSYGQTQHYVVTSMNDNASGFVPGELRWAIDQANNNPGLDYIDFNISLTPPIVIQLNAELPAVTDGVIIDGSTQPANGYTGNEPRIGIKGNTSSILSVLVFYKNPPGSLPVSDASLSEIRNLKLSESSDATLLIERVNNVKIINNTINTSESWGIRLSGASQCIVQGNILGTDNNFSLNPALALKDGNIINNDNAFTGSSNVIGGLNPGEANYFYNTAFHTSIYLDPLTVSGNYNRISGNIFINNYHNINLNPGKGCVGNMCHPVPVYQAVISNNIATVSGTATPNDFVEIYKSNSTGIDAVQLIGTASANSSGQFTLTVSGINVGDNIIATATDPQNNTSEFGPAVAVTSPCVSEMPFSLDSICTNKQFCFAVQARICSAYHFQWNSGDGSPTDTTCGWCHTYTTPGTYTVSLTVSGSSCQTSTVTSSVVVTDCNPPSSCPADSLIVNSGYDHVNNTAFNTGVADAFWTVVSDPDPQTTEPRPAFTINRNPAWSIPFPNSQWLSSYPTSANDLNGLYEFEYTFCLQDINGVSLNMSILADDSAQVLLNGNRILSTQPPTAGSSPFNDPNPHSVIVTDPTKFLVGQNKIRVKVQNVFSVAMGFNAKGILKGAVGAFEDQVCCNPNGSIQGIKWSDANGDGIKSSSEQVLSGWTIKLTNNSTNVSVTAVTDVLGNYYFMNTPPGSYTISEVNQANWSQTFPSTLTYNVNVQPGQAIINKDFGNQYKDCFKCEKLAFGLPDRLCAKQTLTFTNLSSNCIGQTPNFMWNYGDGSPSTVSNQHVYSSPGTYVVTLFIPATETCPQQKFQLEVGIKDCGETCGKCEKLSFSFPDQLCAKQTITFTNTSSFCVGFPTYMWDYGDGSPLTSSNQHVYATPGSYVVTLIIPATAKCPGQKVGAKVEIKDCKIDCPKCEKFDFSFPQVLCIKSLLTFTNQSANCMGSPTFMWDYGDGTPVTYSNQHTYYTAGSYTVTLFILNTTNNCKEEKVKKSIDVKDCDVKCPDCKDLQFRFPERICKGEKITFINTTSGCTDSPVFVWNFGDGSPLSSTSDHTYTSTGTFTVQLIIPGSNDCPDRIVSKRIEVKLCPEFDCKDEVPDPCFACNNISFSFPAQLCVGDSIPFNNTSYNCSGNPVFMWNYGDGSATTASNIHVFQKTGTYTVTLMIPGTDACPAQTVTQTVTITDCCPKCDKLQFSVPDKLCAGEKLTFTNLSSNCTPAPVTFTWNYGDGTPVTTSNVHVYANPGSYVITLTVFTSRNCRTQLIQTKIDVKDCKCPTCDKLDFSFALASVSTSTGTGTEVGGTARLTPAVVPVTPALSFCTGDKIAFTNLSVNCTGNPTFLWDYGDGSAPTTSNQHTYTSPGTYTVTLYIPAANGCPMIKVQKTITIKQCCPTCDKLDFSFALSGSASISTITTSIEGATSQDAVLVPGGEKPVAPTPGPVSFCIGDKIVFTNLSSNCTNNPAPTFMWDYGDGSAPTTSNQHTYTTPGTYVVTLYIPATEGCPMKKVQKTITIKQCCPTCDKLDFSFALASVSTNTNTTTSIEGVNAVLEPVLAPVAPSPGPVSFCIGDKIVFTNLSTNCTNNPAPTFMWDYGDGSAPTTSNQHTYTAAGTYVVTLYIPATNGCPMKKVQKTITIKQCCPTCDNLDFSFNIASTSTSVGTGSETSAARSANPAVAVAPVTSFCTGDKLVFNNLSSKCTNNPAPTFMWDYGDGSAPTVSNQHTYLTPGTYTVTLYIPATNGCPAKKVQKTIVIKQCCPSCEKLSFSGPAQICAKQNVTFTMSNSNCVNAPSFMWNYGDGTAAANSNQHIFQNPGTYVVTMCIPKTATCPEQCVSKTVTVTNCNPCAIDASQTGPVVQSGKWVFTVNPAGGTAPYTYVWTIISTNLTMVSGQGTNTLTTTIPTGGFAAPYNLKVVITDSKGCTVTKTFYYPGN